MIQDLLKLPILQWADMKVLPKGAYLLKNNGYIKVALGQRADAMEREETIEQKWGHCKNTRGVLYNVQKLVKETERRRILEKAILANKPRGDS